MHDFKGDLPPLEIECHHRRPKLIPGLTRKISGIRNYYLMTLMSRKWLSQIDGYISELLIIHYNKQSNSNIEMSS